MVARDKLVVDVVRVYNLDPDGLSSVPHKNCIHIHYCNHIDIHSRVRGGELHGPPQVVDCEGWLAGFVDALVEDLTRVVDFEPVKFQVVVVGLGVGLDLLIALVVVGVLRLIWEARLVECSLHLEVGGLLPVVVALLPPMIGLNHLVVVFRLVAN